MAKYGKPDIFNSDQDSLHVTFLPAFCGTTGSAFLWMVVGRWLDNVFIERLWHSLKYENAYLNTYETGSEAKAGIGKWIDFYNHPSSQWTYGTPWRLYHEGFLKAA